MNKVTRGTYKNNKFLKYSFYSAVFLIIILFFSQILNQNQKSSLLEEISYDLSVDYEKCTLTSNTLIHYYESKVSVPNFFQSTKSLSLFPEIENIKCLGKVTDIKPITNSEINYFVGISPIFSKYIGNLSFLLFLIFSLVYFKKINFYITIFVTTFYFIATDYLFYLNQAAYTITYKILLVLFSIYLSNKTFLKNPEFIAEIKRINFRNDINILRAISVISVLLYHAEFTLFKGGWLGVDIFFVISGFLISNIILSKLYNNTFSLKDFYLRRVKRIFPALYFMLFSSIPLSYLLLSPKNTIEYINNLKYSIPFLSNIYLAQLDLYTAEPNRYSPLLHTWSLSIEEQFYIIFPIFLVLIYKRKIFSLEFIIAFLMFLIGLNYLDVGNISKFYYFHFRSWEFLLGSLIMVISQRKYIKLPKNAEIYGLMLILIPILFFDDKGITNLQPKIICLLGVSLILLNTNKNKILENLSNLKFITLLGTCSYSIYLYHQPVYAFTRIFLRRSFNEITYFTHLGLILLILLISYLSFRFIERPFNQHFSIFKTMVLFSIAAVVAIYSYFGLEQDGYSLRYSDVPDEVLYYSIFPTLYPGDGSIDDWDGYNCESYPISGYETISDNFNSFSGPCRYVKNESSSNLIFIGDSHANTLSVSAVYWGEKIPDSFDFIPIYGTIGRCLLTSQTDDSSFRYDCTETFFNNFLNNLNSEDTVVIIGRFPLWIDEIGKEQMQCSENCEHIKTIKDRIIKISERSSKVILVYPVPTHPYNISESYFNRQNTWGEIVSTDYKYWTKIASDSNYFLNSIQSDNIERIFTENLFCDSLTRDVCVAVTRESLLYADDNHLTVEGNYLVLDEIIKILDKK
jgi:peptidoglycan/LPS O-acetylase OafA/YrhL